MHRVKVGAAAPYEVVIGHGILEGLGEAVRALPRGGRYKRVAVITDDVVNPLYGNAVCGSLERAGYSVTRFVFPNGEGSKQMDTAMEILGFLCDHTLTRSDLVVALGGGVVGDITGFAAAIYQRGVDYIQVPTTLLAAVDSSVGGKTAVNIPHGKNLVGAFWQPQLVWCDTATLDSLGADIFSDGMAEVIKYGCIWDEALFADLEQGDARDRLEEIIARCVEIKAQVVAKDELDNGLRQILNFGHTVGHAIEKASGFQLSHGRGVAMGMAIAARAGQATGITPVGTDARIAALLERYGLPAACPYPIAELAGLCLGDKKRSGDTIAFVLLDRIGHSLTHPVEVEKVPKFLGV